MKKNYGKIEMNYLFNKDQIVDKILDVINMGNADKPVTPDYVRLYTDSFTSSSNGLGFMDRSLS